MTDTPTTPTPPESTDVPEAAPIVAPALPYTLKANLQEYRRRLGVWRILLALGITVFFFYKFGFIGWLISVVAIGALIGIILWFLVRRSLEITQGELAYKNAFGKIRKIRFSDIEGVKVFVNYYEPAFGVAPRVSIAPVQGEPISLYSLYWPIDELDKLLAVLRDAKINTEYYADVASYSMISAQFPKYATYVERHPWGIAWAIVGAIVLGVTAFVLADHFLW